MRGLLMALVMLAGCERAPAEPAALPVATVDADRVEAEKACAAITGYRPGGADGALAAEYRACVAAVVDDDAPALRGRTMPPP